ncbi:hypothetical protein STCU_01144 [Strigomonas culicis]|uniref:Uncharacterized protein n=1 Tax=Strigomonas culicis TaxID=28005 RepID=S9WI20_9TRYP|nr:hypothetical protein STCU_03447 [Strigomonas culicis]EPY35530.1 hypothetical protein STCU_01144 [Strigomonas culicis]|eukprot:EPY31455.1 hypothetical protein STCU_03447 [Strigomonas culicis]
MSRHNRSDPLVDGDQINVLDMGLDFRSYLSRVDSKDVAVLGNIISYPAAKVPDVFEPTVGLLVTILHSFCHSKSDQSATTWLQVYDTIEEVYIEHCEPNATGKQHAEESRRVIAAQLGSGLPKDYQAFCNKLLRLLDDQSGIRGPQAPSSRKMPREPKGAFCNLHLADHKCYQEFSCNQLHLHEAGPVRHRMNFFQNLASVLLKENHSRSEIINRVRDSIFFARYGNKVTVKYHGIWIPFFKTIYTDGRLEQAFRMQQYICTNYSCKNEHCKGIHSQDTRTPQPNKPMDLSSPLQISQELDEEAEHIVSSVEMEQQNESLPPFSLPSSDTMESSDVWRGAVRDFVRQSNIPHVEADEALLRTLQDTKVGGTPMSSASERMTPLLDELDIYNFNLSEASMDHKVLKH